ncbi:protein obstructor-E-like [Artemia franciscana]|uniref:Chitin-binding type-2 domain-containing protein n=1 Tax=Artemia franciscana TaxID=6661 RepID=A0AA88I9R0_ARTSF|nr:hypothetical protein QYM36_007667 [Artemia franciscana]
MAKLFVISVLVASAYGQFNCPLEDGYFGHDTSCDKYWRCEDGKAELKVCGNGLAFDDTDKKHQKENCDYLHNVDCGERDELEPAVGTKNCPRLYGIFADELRCDVFWSCWNGEANRYQCAPGLAYDREARVCMWADQVPECKVEEVGNGFQCPADAPAAGSFTRHAHPEDCRKYYVCLDGSPREYGCPVGTVFKIGDDDSSGFCADPEEVEGCEDYYGELDLKTLKKSDLLSGLNQNGGTTRKPLLRNSAAIKRVTTAIPVAAAAEQVEEEYEYEYEEEQ